MRKLTVAISVMVVCEHVLVMMRNTSLIRFVVAISLIMCECVGCRFTSRKMVQMTNDYIGNTETTVWLLKLRSVSVAYRLPR